jgi:hypothetical protein
MKHIIKKILKEENLKHNLKQQIKDYGIKDAAELVGGMDNFLSLMNFESPMDFLHLFDDLNVVQSKEEKDWTLFRYKPKNNIMVYDIIINEVYINYDEIWSVLQSHFDINYFEIQELTKRWLDEVYNLRDITMRAGRKRTQVV